MRTEPEQHALGDAPARSDATSDNRGRRLIDPYGVWTEEEGIPVHTDFAHDLLTLETAPWDRYGARGCFAHTHGMGDFMANYVLEVPPTATTSPIQHMYEAFFFVLSGYGSTTVWLPNGELRTFEWGPKALFAIPLNCTYQIMNGSSLEPARLSCTNNAPITFNLFHSTAFVFDNPVSFPERTGLAKDFDGDGDLTTYNKGGRGGEQHIWETNFIHDLTSFELYALESRGKGSKNVAFVLADGTMHAHVSQIPVGGYKKAHRHAAGTHVHALDDDAYTLLWYEGDSEFQEIPWRHGIMFTPPFWMFHQHLNAGPMPARYLACSLGSRRYPFLSLRRKTAEGWGSVSVSQGGRQIEYEEQDPRIHRGWLEAIGKTGVPSEMGEVFDEEAILALDEASLQGVISTPKSTGPAV